MRERTRESIRWRSSPSRSRNRDRGDWGWSDRRDFSSRSGRSPARSGWDSSRLDVCRTDWEAGVGVIQREYRDSNPHEAERRRRDGFSKREREEEGDDDRWKKLSRFQRNAFPGEVYPDRCESVRTTEENSRQGARDAVRSEEELYLSHEAERSREIDDFVRSTMKQYWRDNPEPSRSISSRGYSNSVSPVRNVVRNDEVNGLGSSGSRNYSDIGRRRMQSYRNSEHERLEPVFDSMKGERSGKRCCEHGIENDCHVPASRMSCVGSSSAEMQQDNYRRVSLNSSSVFSFSDSDRNHRKGDRQLGCGGHCCASGGLHTRDLDRYVDRNSSRGFPEDEKEKSFHNCSYSQGRNLCCCVSSTAGKWNNDMVGASRESHHRGGCSSVSDITIKELCVDNQRLHMDQEPVHYMHMRGPLLKPRVTESVIIEVGGASTMVDYQARERLSDQHDFVKEHCPVVEPGSSMLHDRNDEGRYYRKVHHEERDDAYWASKTPKLRKDYQLDVHGMTYPDTNESDVMVDRDERYVQSRRICRSRGKEAYLDNENRQVQNDYEFESYGRIYPDVNGSNATTDRDERALQFRKICPNNENQSQQVQRDYELDFYAKMYTNVNGSEVMVDQNERALQYRKMGFNKGKDTYLENGSQQLQKDYESDSYARVYLDASQPSALIVNRDEEIQYRRHHLDGETQVYLDDESAQLGKANQVHHHDRRWEPDGRRELYANGETLHTRNDYSFKSHVLGEPGDVENIAEVNYGDVEQFGIAYEKPENIRFGDPEIAYDRIDEQYAAELTSSEQTRYFVDERSFNRDDQNRVLASRPRVPVKERLGGRVKDPSSHVKNRLGPGKKGLPWVKNGTQNRKSQGKNQKNSFKAQHLQWGNSSNV